MSVETPYTLWCFHYLPDMSVRFDCIRFERFTSALHWVCFSPFPWYIEYCSNSAPRVVARSRLGGC